MESKSGISLDDQERNGRNDENKLSGDAYEHASQMEEGKREEENIGEGRMKEKSMKEGNKVEIEKGKAQMNLKHEESEQERPPIEKNSEKIAEENNMEMPQSESKQEETRQEEVKQEEAKQEGARQEETRQEKDKQEKDMQEETRQEEDKQEEDKQDDTKPEEIRQEETKQEETRQEDTRQEEVKQQEAKQEEVKQQEAKQEDTRQEEVGKEGDKQDFKSENKADTVEDKQNSESQDMHGTIEDKQNSESHDMHGAIEDKQNSGSHDKKDKAGDKQDSESQSIKETTGEKQDSESQDTEASANDKQDSESSESDTKQAAQNETFIDFSKLSKEALIDKLKVIMESPIEEIKDKDIDSIKINFYKKRKLQIDKLKKEFVEQGGELIDFTPPADPLEDELKSNLQKYKSRKAEQKREIEESREENLRKKYEIIEEIKDLINKDESINKTFQEFRDLQQRWRETGLVPQSNLKDLWETYHHHVEKFYDYIKINKELRDLDLKKNMEAKIRLCEKAEELLFNPSEVRAFNELQKLHEQWREIGPVPKQHREPLWERFKEATRKINKKHHEYYQELKAKQKKNLEEKAAICEEVEEINKKEITDHKEWEAYSNKIKEFQRGWKKIGFAPKKQNNAVFQRFRNACDEFFINKRAFYAKHKEIQQNNLQLKIDLCKQAEALKDSTDWKKTTDDFIKLQKTWKEIGPVPKNKSESVWRRFRSACDHFFERKKAHFSNIDQEYEENLKKKEALIQEIENFKPASDNIQENLNKLKEFQRQWTEIGYVPIKQKDKIRDRYRAAINQHFDKLQIDDNRKNVMKFKTKMETMKESPNQNNRLKKEREKLVGKLTKIENDIALWENNMGFFTKSSNNADSMIEDMENKIENAKKQIQLLEEKINMIDNTIE